MGGILALRTGPGGIPAGWREARETLPLLQRRLSIQTSQVDLALGGARILSGVLPSRAVYTLDLNRAAAPRISYTYAAFVEAHSLVSKLGLQATRWFVETDQTHEGKPIFTAEIAPLVSAQQQALSLGCSSVLVSRRPPLTADDWPLLDEAWQAISTCFEPADIREFHLDALHAAAIVPAPGLLVPRPGVARPAAAKSPAKSPEAAPVEAPAAPVAPPGSAPVAPPAAPALGPAPADLAAIRALLIATFPEARGPVEGTGCRLSCVEVTERDGVVIATLRLWGFDLDGPEPTVRDIKEQDCFFGPVARLIDNPKFPAFLEGWRQALVQLFQQAGEKYDRWMPHDLVHLSALDLKKISTVDEYRDALLLRSRLGKLL